MRDKVIWEWITLAFALVSAVVIPVVAGLLIWLGDGWWRWLGVGIAVVIGIAIVQTWIESRRPRERGVIHFNPYDKP